MGRRKKQDYEQIEYDYDEDDYEEDNGFFSDMKKEISGIIIIAFAILLGIAVFCGNDSGTLLDYIKTVTSKKMILFLNSGGCLMKAIVHDSMFDKPECPKQVIDVLTHYLLRKKYGNQ